MQIRVLALGILIDAGRIFVFEGFDPVKNSHYYRPLGGGVEFGESGEVALKREFLEELGKTLIQIQYLMTLENLFTYKGQAGHEIIRFYQARFEDSTLYQQAEIMGKEDNGKPFKALWMPLKAFVNSELRLVPEQLLDYLAHHPSFKEYF